ncbi:MAG: DNA methyltransferase, partial [Dolichospermum sp.]
CIALITGLSNVLGKGSLLAYLVSMTLRITEIHRVLKPTGSFYLHCDPTASHYLKLILDAIFCAQGGDFQNEIIWSYKTGGATKKRFARKHDVVFFYTKTKNYLFNPQKEKSYMMHKYGFKKSDFQIDKETGLQYSMVYQKDVFDIPSIGSESAERLGYPTQKPESLLERIIKASSNENDIILDAYSGCGTTVAVCQKLDRQWIGIDITYQSISLILKRLEDSFPGVLKTIKLHGIPKDIESARALANKTDDRTRKEFEKWAILTYTNNKAVINAKKGADKGIDGIVYFQGDKNDPEKIIFQVKSGKVKSGDIRDLLGTMTIESASLAIFITLEEPTKDMLKTAKSAGFYQSKYMSHSCDKIQIVTIQDIIEQQKILNIRLSYEVLKSAEKQKEVKVNQIELDF